MRVINLVYKWCWIISSDFHRQYAFGDHSPLPSIFLFMIAMHDKHLVHETTTLSILDSNVDFESHAIIDSSPHSHQHTTGTIPQHFQCFDFMWAWPDQGQHWQAYMLISLRGNVTFRRWARPWIFSHRYQIGCTVLMSIFW